MNTKRFKAGDKVTYVDLFHAVVLAQHDNGVTIAFHGKGYLQGEKIIKRVSIQWIEHGWNEIQPICKHNEGN